MKIINTNNFCEIKNCYSKQVTLVYDEMIKKVIATCAKHAQKTATKLCPTGYTITCKNCGCIHGVD